MVERLPSKQRVAGSRPALRSWAIVAQLADARDLNSRFLWVRLPPMALLNNQYCNLVVWRILCKIIGDTHDALLNINFGVVGLL